MRQMDTSVAEINTEADTLHRVGIPFLEVHR